MQQVHKKFLETAFCLTVANLLCFEIVYSSLVMCHFENKSIH